MERNAKHILSAGVLLGYISILYFISLPLHFPFAVTLIIVFAVTIAFAWYMSKRIPSVAETGNVCASLLLAGGVIILTAASALLVRKHGDIDAVSNWNFIARYLYRPDNWRQLFWHSGTEAHPDYPLLYPGAIAFFQRLLRTESMIAGLGITYLATMFIPVLVFITNYKKQLYLAAASMLFFVVNGNYVNQGLNQYADVLLAFYFLGAFVSIRAYLETYHKAYIFLCFALLGCMVWLKNEGSMLAIIFIMCYLPELFRARAWKQALAGMAPFALVLIYLKWAYPVENDLITLQSKPFSFYLADKSRYKMILQHLQKSLSEHYSVLMITFSIYAGYCLLAQKMPAKPVAVLLLCIGAYLAVYLISPRDLEWMLQNSIERLLVHLMPSMVYILINELSKLKLSVNDA
jgi:hypothetical protein